MLRSVLNVDIAAFPIAVERVIDRGLRGRPVLLAPPGSARAPVLVVSQEAAREGVRAGMPLPVALRRCPGAAVLHPNEALYKRATGAVLALLGGYSPLVEPAALGQTFLDLTGTVRLFGAAQDAAARIRREIEERLRLKPTVGLATSKLVSRVAARVIRPDGLCDVFPGSEGPFLAPLPVGLLPAARGETGERLLDLNVARVADLLRISQAQLVIAFGAQGGRLRSQALGIDASPVRPPETAPAIVEGETLAEDSNEAAALLRALFGLCERAGRRLRRLGARAGRLRLSPPTFCCSRRRGGSASGRGRGGCGCAGSSCAAWRSRAGRGSWRCSVRRRSTTGPPTAGRPSRWRTRSIGSAGASATGRSSPGGCSRSGRGWRHERRAAATASRESAGTDRSAYSAATAVGLRL